MAPTSTLRELHHLGLLDDADEPHLTDKGRDWLRALGDLETGDTIEITDDAGSELVLSTNALFR